MSGTTQPPSDVVRWGVVGTGAIAGTVSADLALTPGAVLAAVCSRDGDRSAAFAERHGFAGTATDVAAMAADVDVVYVATPHTAHLAAATAALEAGTPVLVEKPVTATLAGAQQLVALARERGVFCMEAMWTRFLPATVALVDAVAGGAVGRPLALRTDVGFVAPDDPASRLLDPAQGGGALLDVGIYGVWLSRLLLGPVTSVAAAGELHATGADVSAGQLLQHEGRGVSLLSTSLVSRGERAAVLEGTDGWVSLGAPAWVSDSSTVHGADGSAAPATSLGHRGTGYVHMLEHVQECLRQGLTESPLHPLGTTLEVMAVLERALDQLGATRAREVAG